MKDVIWLLVHSESENSSWLSHIGCFRFPAGVETVPVIEAMQMLESRNNRAYATYNIRETMRWIWKKRKRISRVFRALFFLICFIKKKKVYFVYFFFNIIFFF